MTDQNDQWMRELREQEQARFRLKLNLMVRMRRAGVTRNWTGSLLLLGTAVTLVANWRWAEIQILTPFGAWWVLSAAGLVASVSQLVVDVTRAKIERLEEPPPD